ncbi:MAG TPA: hypothetical protein VIY73_05705, partial [Polyangiaceae bacterium]
MQWNDGRLLLPGGAALEVTARGPRAAVRWEHGALELFAMPGAPSGEDDTLELAVKHPLAEATQVWVPHLTPDPGNVAGDWVFRCPVVVVADATVALALVVDVDDVHAAAGWRAWLDYDHPRSTLTLGAGAYRHEG